jgi:hypothetical protein
MPVEVLPAFPSRGGELLLEGALLVLHLLEVVFVGLHREFLREEEVAGEARAYFHVVADAAQVLYVLAKNYVHMVSF